MIKESTYADEDLLAAIGSSKTIDKALQYLINTHYGKLESMILANSGTTEDAADIIQDAMVAFVEMVKKNKFRGDAAIGTLLYTLSRNLWISELRRRGRADKRNHVFEKTKEKYEEHADEYLVYKETQKQLLNTLQNLGDKCRDILLMVYYENLSMKEIAERADYSNEQVLRNKKHKCMKELEKRITVLPGFAKRLKSILLYGK